MVQDEIQKRGYNDEKGGKEQVIVTKVTYALHVQVTFYKEKSGNQWLKLGDRCTKFLFTWKQL